MRNFKAAIEKAKAVHNNYYGYDHAVEPKDFKTPITITCPVHGDFQMTLNNHIYLKERCPKCAGKTIGGKEDFINKSNEVHHNFYDYSEVCYVNNYTKVTIICPVHGRFEQTPMHHLEGQGCPSCFKLSNRKTCFNELVNTLQGFNPEIKVVGNRIFDKDSIVLFYDLKPNKKLDLVKDRRKYLEAGYKKIIMLYEDEYLLNKTIVIEKMKHIFRLGEKKEKIMGRKCNIKVIEKEVAKEFLTKYHIQGFSLATVYLGAYCNEKLVGVMEFVDQRNGNWNLSRFATDYHYVCQGIGGKLFAYFTRNYDFEEIKSFSDKRWMADAENNFYTALGFVFDSEVPVSYTYYNSNVNKYRRFHKFGFRKQILHRKYGLPLDMTELEMTKKLNYVRIWDCGLVRYVFRKDNKINV